ncbi:MAG TPA: hypothetical protein VIG40_06545 [Tissierellaceae bacterium]
MNYYVRVETTEKSKAGNKKFFELNISLDDIKKYIIDPYKESERVYIDNRFIEYSDILQLSVFQSEKTAEQLADEVQKTVPDGFLVFYSPIDVINNNYMKNITKELIFG